MFHIVFQDRWQETLSLSLLQVHLQWWGLQVFSSTPCVSVVLYSWPTVAGLDIVFARSH